MMRLIRIWLFMMTLAVLPVSTAFGQEFKLKVDDRLKSMPGKELVDVGLIYLNERNMPDSALLCFTIVANRRFVAQKDTVEMMACADALNFMGVLYKAWFSDYQKAWQYYHLSEEYANKHGLKTQLPKIHNNMTGLTLLNALSVHQESELVIDSILEESKQTYCEAADMRQEELMGVIAANQAYVGLKYDKIEQISPVLSDFCKKVSLDTDIPFLLHARYMSQAVLTFRDHHQLNKSLCYLDSALSYGYGRNVQEKSNDSVIIYEMKSTMLFRAGLPERAFAMADSVVEIAKRHEHHIGLSDIYKQLNDYFKEIGNMPMAEKNELLFLREKDYLVNQSKLRDIDKAQIMFEIEKLNQEASEQAQRERMKTYLMYGVGFIAVLLMCMLVWIFRRYQQTQQKNRLLYQNNINLLAAHAEEVRRLEETMAGSKETHKAKYDKNPMDEEGKLDLMHRVLLVMEKSEDVFKPNFTIDRLAELVDANPTYVSYVINEKRQCNFNVLLNEYRIKEACRRMNDVDQYGHLTIEGIAASVGIKSRTNFTTNFKKFTGLTPSEYQRMAHKNSEQ